MNSYICWWTDKDGEQYWNFKTIGEAVLFANQCFYRYNCTNVHVVNGLGAELYRIAD